MKQVLKVNTQKLSLQPAGSQCTWAVCSASQQAVINITKQEVVISQLRALYLAQHCILRPCLVSAVLSRVVTTPQFRLRPFDPSSLPPPPGALSPFTPAVPPLSTSSNFVSLFPPAMEATNQRRARIHKVRPARRLAISCAIFCQGGEVEEEEDDTKCWEIRLQSVSAKEGPAAGWEEND